MRNHNVVGLTDDEGEPAAWFGYTPYGELDFAQAGSSPHAPLALASRVGHQGLFFDNLETPWAANQLSLRGNGAGHAGLYHNRNRSYLPSLGRFAQTDPNASGQLVSYADWWMGIEPLAWHPQIDLAEMFGDGMNLHQRARNSPIDLRDPHGLFIGGMLGMLGGAPESLDPYLDYNDEVYDTGTSLFGLVMNLSDGYAFDQLLDLHWASDWNQADDFYRGSAAYDMGTGSWATFWGIDDAATPEVEGPAMARAGGVAAKAAKAAMGGVYSIVDKRTGETLYIGRTNNLERRRGEHYGKNGNYNSSKHDYNILHESNDKIPEGVLSNTSSKIKTQKIIK